MAEISIHYENFFQEAFDRIELAMEFHHDFIFQLPRILFKKYQEIVKNIFRENLEQVIKFMKKNKQPNIKGKDAVRADLQCIISAIDV